MAVLIIQWLTCWWRREYKCTPFCHQSSPLSSSSLCLCRAGAVCSSPLLFSASVSSVLQGMSGHGGSFIGQPLLGAKVGLFAQTPTSRKLLLKLWQWRARGGGYQKQRTECTGYIFCFLLFTWYLCFSVHAYFFFFFFFSLFDVIFFGSGLVYVVLVCLGFCFTALWVFSIPAW